MMITITCEIECIAQGIDGAEGPVFDCQGRLFCVEPTKGRILQITDGQKHEYAHTDGVPAGFMLDQEGTLWVADMARGLLRVNDRREVLPVVERYEGQTIRGCNDLIFSRKGLLYFTAPAGSGPKNPIGEVFCRTLDGIVHRFDAGFAFCNGIAVSPDDRTLIVAETFTKHLYAYDLEEDGMPRSPRRVFATLAGNHVGGPDGIDFDIEGNLLATNWGGSCIEVFNVNGCCDTRIQLPFKKPSNLHFGGMDGKDLFVTEHSNNAIWRTRWRTRGLLTFPIG
ncbi:MAG: SMP-30/gluconolactonase/LRE family protein [Phycisphaeraceae bacterium]|nr:SMP-30/gluconolactonase/LRE family protein [Phycisphaeraceae bacterium]